MTNPSAEIGPAVSRETLLNVTVRVIRDPIAGDQEEKVETVRAMLAAKDTVATLKQLLATETGISSRRQKLVLAGRVLFCTEAIGAPNGIGFMGLSGERVVLLLKKNPLRRGEAVPFSPVSE